MQGGEGALLGTRSSAVPALTLGIGKTTILTVFPVELGSQWGILPGRNRLNPPWSFQMVSSWRYLGERGTVKWCPPALC